MKFLTRFQRLERSRRTGEGASRTTGERFRAIEPVAPIPEVRGGDLARFAPAAEAPLELQPPSDAQPFVRCPGCGVDSPLGARRCVCGTALDTLEAVAFNTALWDRHREDRTRHEEEQQRARAEDLEEARRVQQERRALGESIALEIAEREGLGPASRWSRRLTTVVLVLCGAGVLLRLGPVGRGVLAFLVGAACVALGVGWYRRRSVEIDPGGGSTVDR
ncbi:MAG TPA: hypothetical protein VFD38_16770 [Myxococcaceae bacterium]|nr:hypothetical protein [Myxococcaceae bacterium]